MKVPAFGKPASAARVRQISSPALARTELPASGQLSRSPVPLTEVTKAIFCCCASSADVNVQENKRIVQSGIRPVVGFMVPSGCQACKMQVGPEAAHWAHVDRSRGPSARARLVLKLADRPPCLVDGHLHIGKGTGV